MTRVLAVLGAATGLREADVRIICNKAPIMYKYFTIPKKSGGNRLIAQPSQVVKFLQSAFVNEVLSNLPIHECATAYRKNYSIAMNARPHAVNGPILKMDLKDFFPSIRGADWRSYCKDHNLFDDSEDINLSESLLFHRPPGARLLRLAIGAPSSPMLSNILMFKFDELVSRAVSGDHVTYTRYADDLTFSAKRTGYLVNVKSQVAKTIRILKYPRLDINDDKTIYITKKYHRVVTGVTLTNDGNISIGRDKKREISAGVHRSVNGKLLDNEYAALAGKIAYANSIDPDFIRWLDRKYGEGCVKLIQQLGWMIGHEDEPKA
jgi:hypothetical protein